MRIALFGPAGALGRKIIAQHAGANGGANGEAEIVPIYRSMYSLRSVEETTKCLQDTGADAIINCTGIFPVRGSTALDMVLINALFPHVLACASRGVPTVLVSTDRVFSGRASYRYTVSTPTDADDLFGKSRAVGEVLGPNICVVRTSYLDPSYGFMRWLINAKGPVEGWRNSLWSGSMIDVVAERLVGMVGTVGRHHLSTANTINKYDLACKLVEKLGLELEVIPKLAPMINYSLQPTVELPPIDEALNGWRNPSNCLANSEATKLCTENTN